MRVGVTIEASPKAVWAAIQDISTHVEWMDDAVAIRFTSRRRAGVGTSFDCDTKVGPFRLTDRMVITEWKPGRAMGVRHEGIVTGSGRFTLRRRGRGRTRFTWDERLVVPWRLGGPAGAAAGAVVLRRVWRRNLRHLKAMVEARGASTGRGQTAALAATSAPVKQAAPSTAHSTTGSRSSLTRGPTS